MPKTHNTDVVCPHCGKDSSAVIMERFNAGEDAELLPALKDRSIFIHICPECQKPTYLDYNFLYEDEESRIAVWYASTPEEEETAKIGAKTMALARRIEEPWLIRVVLGWAEFGEKLQILEDGLDDRLVEIMKLLVVNEFVSKHGDYTLDGIFYGRLSDGKAAFLMTQNGKLLAASAFTNEHYAAVRKAMEQRLPSLREDEPVINADRMYERLQEMGVIR